MQALNAAVLALAVELLLVDGDPDDPGLLLELHAARASTPTLSTAAACRERFTRLLPRN
jgi:hypothetical protein